MKSIFIVLLLTLISVLGFSQHKIIKVKVFFKSGKTITGECKLKHIGAGFDRVRMQTDNSAKYTYKTNKFDSLLVGNYMWYVKDKRLYREFVRGTISLFGVDSAYSIKAGRNRIAPHLDKDIGKVAHLLDLKDDTNNISKGSFITLVEKFNNKEQNVEYDFPKYDSLVHFKSKHIFRTGIFWNPHILTELKIFNHLTIVNSFNINSGGNFWRNAKTYFNFDLATGTRYYYKYNRRKKKGKETYNFSAPFVSIEYKHLIEIDRPNIDAIAITHGWQGNGVFNNGFLSYQLGGLYSISDNSIGFMSLLKSGWFF